MDNMCSVVAPLFIWETTPLSHVGKASGAPCGQDAYSMLGSLSVKFLIRIDKVANKDFATILWKIVAESTTDNICLLDCCIEILHADKEVVKLCSRFHVPESRAVTMNL